MVLREQHRRLIVHQLDERGKRFLEHRIIVPTAFEADVTATSTVLSSISSSSFVVSSVNVSGFTGINRISIFLSLAAVNHESTLDR